MRPLFDFNDVENFDEHINDSIPTYDRLNDIASRIVSDFTQLNTAVIDIGCSTGRFMKQLPKAPSVSYIGIDSQFAPRNEDGVTFIEQDILDYSMPEASVIVSMFTLQFLPLRDRAKVLGNIKDSLVTGGVFVCAEKTHMANPHLEMSMQSELLHTKRNKFTDTEIIDKTVGLSSVMRCRTKTELVTELSEIGTVDSVWQWGSFVCHAVVTK